MTTTHPEALNKGKFVHDPEKTAGCGDSQHRWFLLLVLHVREFCSLPSEVSDCNAYLARSVHSAIGHFPPKSVVYHFGFFPLSFIWSHSSGLMKKGECPIFSIFFV